jgi:hypothetical protein
MRLRFRHPQAASIKSVTINGKPWHAVDKDKETILVEGVVGKTMVVANY